MLRKAETDNSEDEKLIPNDTITALAAKNVAARPNFLSKTLVSDQEFEKFNQLYKFIGEKYDPRANFTGDIRDNPWSSEYTFVKSVMVAPRDNPEQAPKTYHISFFYYPFYTRQTDNNLYFFMCFSSIFSPDGRISCAISQKEDSEKKVTKYLYVNSIKAHSNYRLGSALIQCAVEFSFQMGLEGRIHLKSINESGQFYFKLGFISKDPWIAKRLYEGEKCDGMEMFLPEESIAAWKKRIADQPLLGRRLIEAEQQKFTLFAPKDNVDAPSAKSENTFSCR